MPKITIIGAGSFVFARRLVTDILTWPSLQDSVICLMDVNETKIAKELIRKGNASSPTPIDRVVAARKFDAKDSAYLMTYTIN